MSWMENDRSMVGGFNPSEQYYSSQLRLLFPIYGKIIVFQTTNQI